MSTEFKPQDSVQLLHGLTPIMVLSEINEVDQTALCVWYDRAKTKNIKQAWIPLNALRHTPERAPLSSEDILGAFRR